MKKPSVLFLIVLFLATVVGALFAWRVFLLPKQPPQPTPLPTPTPESRFPLPSPSPPLKERGDSPENLLRALKERFPLIESLPYQTEKYSLDYRAPLHLEVKLKAATKSAELEKEISDWIWSQGVNPATHQIDWITPEP